MSVQIIFTSNSLSQNHNKDISVIGKNLTLFMILQYYKLFYYVFCCLTKLGEKCFVQPVKTKNLLF